VKNYLKLECIYNILFHKMKVIIVFSHKASAINIKLIKFFKINLRSLNKANIVFGFEVAHAEDADKYNQRNIKTFPTLVNGATQVSGTDKIIEYLKHVVTKHNETTLNKTEADCVDDFWRQTLGKVSTDESGNLQVADDDEDDASEDLHHKIQQAFEDRSKSLSEARDPSSNRQPSRQNNQQSTRPNNVIGGESPAETIKRMRSKGRGNMDDALMANFFENQEATQ
jgi:hypothetical protein